VLFVDFGNSETVKADELYHLTDEFVRESCHAIQCRTTLVCPADDESSSYDTALLTADIDALAVDEEVKQSFFMFPT